jgi:CheY-like chemotaxis protein
VLLVDDNEDQRLFYSEALCQAGYVVFLAANGNEGVHLALSQPPHAIVMDMFMPGLDGWEATRVLKSYVQTRLIPIIGLSSVLSEGAHSDAALQAGCSRLLVKPCPPEDLVRVLGEVLAGASTRTA